MKVVRKVGNQTRFESLSAGDVFQPVSNFVIPDTELYLVIIKNSGYANGLCAMLKTGSTYKVPNDLKVIYVRGSFVVED